MTEYATPSLTVDAVVLAGEGKHMRLLVIERGKAPFQGQWALPGGFVDKDENPAMAVLRELEEETGLKPKYSGIPLSLRARKGRDPRGWTVSQPYLFHLPDEVAVQAGDDAAKAQWVSLGELDRLAFDHGAMLCEALGCFWPAMPTWKPVLKGIAPFGGPNRQTPVLSFYGGSFNPPHEGHLECVKGHPIRQILIVVPDANPFKEQGQDGCAWRHYRMLQAYFGERCAAVFPGFCGMEWANPSYDWLIGVKADKVGLLIGDDSLHSLPKWYRAADLVRLIDHLYVVPRHKSGSELDADFHWVRSINPELNLRALADHPHRDKSSTALRG